MSAKTGSCENSIICKGLKPQLAVNTVLTIIDIKLRLESLSNLNMLNFIGTSMSVFPRRLDFPENLKLNSRK